MAEDTHRYHEKEVTTLFLQDGVHLGGGAFEPLGKLGGDPVIAAFGGCEWSIKSPCR